MNFDDFYMLKLSIKISDYDNALKYYKKTRSKFDNEIFDNLSLFNKDFKIYSLFLKEKIHTFDFLLNMVKNPFNNYDLIVNFIDNNNNSKIQIDHFYDKNKSLMLTLLQNPMESRKKLKLFDYFLNLENFNFNVKNCDCQTNSNILVENNPTDIDSVYLEKIEKLLKNKNEENKFLFFNPFKKTTKNDLKNKSQPIDIKNEILNFIYR